jgi:hypothetical protein
VLEEFYLTPRYLDAFLDGKVDAFVAAIKFNLKTPNRYQTRISPRLANAGMTLEIVANACE